MPFFTLVLNIIGGLCMFLFGMKTMSDGLQQSAGDRMRKTLNFMTGNRWAGLFTGIAVTAIVQSSSAVSVIVISFVNAGLLTLTQSIGVIFGVNIGTTITAWIVSVVGFKISIGSFALPAIGIGFIFSVLKWKHKNLGGLLLGFGFLFLGLSYITDVMRSINEIIDFDTIGTFRDMGHLAILIGGGAGFLITILVHSSSASIALIMTMVFNGIVTYEMAAGMVLGSNIGTTVDAALASIGASTAAKRTSLVHVLFNVLGTAWAIPLLLPLLNLVEFIMPGNPFAVMPSGNIAATTHLAALHTIFNIINTLAFLPFVNQFSALVSFIVREKQPMGKSGEYKFEYLSSVMADSPELNILRVEKEIRDMAGITSEMFARFSTLLKDLHKIENKEKAAAELCSELKQKEEYTDDMRESLTSFLIECTREKLTAHSERRVSQLLRAINNIEEMSDDCYLISLLLEKNIRKNRLLSDVEMENLVPYLNKVEQFLSLLQEQLWKSPKEELAVITGELEADINKSQKKLQKLSRKRIETGKDVKAELFFIDLVRRIEKLGDYCYEISGLI